MITSLLSTGLLLISSLTFLGCGDRQSLIERTHENGEQNLSEEESNTETAEGFQLSNNEIDWEKASKEGAAFKIVALNEHKKEPTYLLSFVYDIATLNTLLLRSTIYIGIPGVASICTMDLDFYAHDNVIKKGGRGFYSTSCYINKEKVSQIKNRGIELIFPRQNRNKIDLITKIFKGVDVAESIIQNLKSDKVWYFLNYGKRDDGLTVATLNFYPKDRSIIREELEKNDLQVYVDGMPAVKEDGSLVRISKDDLSNKYDTTYIAVILKDFYFPSAGQYQIDLVSKHTVTNKLSRVFRSSPVVVTNAVFDLFYLGCYASDAAKCKFAFPKLPILVDTIDFRGCTGNSLQGCQVDASHIVPAADREYYARLKYRLQENSRLYSISPREPAVIKNAVSFTSNSLSVNFTFE